MSWENNNLQAHLQATYNPVHDTDHQSFNDTVSNPGYDSDCFSITLSEEYNFIVGIKYLIRVMSPPLSVKSLAIVTFQHHT